MKLSQRDIAEYSILGLSLLFYPFNQWIGLLGFFIIYAKRSNNMKLDSSSGMMLLLYIIAFAFFTIFSVANGTMTLPTTLNIFVSSFLMYRIGFSYVNSSSCADENQPEWLLSMFVIGMAMALPHIVLSVRDIAATGLVNPSRVLTSLGDRADFAITLRVIALSLSLGWVSYIFHVKYFGDYKAIAKVSIVISILSLFCSFHFVSRTGIAVFAISLIVGYIFTNRKIFSINSLLYVILVLCCVHLFMHSEIYQIYEMREKDYSSILNFGGRDKRWVWAWNNIMENPFGSKDTIYYAHNLWLDFGKDGGVISFFALVLFSIVNLIQVKKIVTSGKFSSIISLSVAIYAIVFFMSNFTECIHEGLPLFLIIYCFFCGSISRMVNS